MEEQKSQDPHSFDQRWLSTEGKYTIPEGVTEIAFRGFRGKGIKSIEIPWSVEIIERWAFLDSGLESLNIPSSVKIIGKGAFEKCENLKHASLHEGLLEIEDGAFCLSGLESINIPISVKSIWGGAFDRCKNLKPFYGSGLESINICKTFEFYMCRN